MPSRNIIKQYGASQYYHIYSRGVAKQNIFNDSQDYGYFLQLFKRYLSPNAESRKHHAPYPCYHNRIKLVAYCLMPNHIHMLIYQEDKDAMTCFMRSLVTSYVMYFNKKYDRVGPLFQSNYKASLILQAKYLEHITRYIHLNPLDWRNYEYSSLVYFSGSKSTQWLKPEHVLNIFSGFSDYMEFLEEFKDQKYILCEIQKTVAG